MKNKYTIKVLILLAVFLFSAVIFEFIMNDIQNETVKDMENETFPVIEFESQGNTINRLFGYKKEIKITSIKNLITPVDKEQRLKLYINAYDTPVDEVGFKVYSTNGKKVIVSNDAVIDSKKTQQFDVELDFKSKLEKNSEYTLEIKLMSGDKPMYYYSRIMATKGMSEKECLDFAKEFHDVTFDKEKAKEFIAKYMEQTHTKDSTLAHVDLSNSVSQVTWGSLEPEEVVKPVYNFNEINDSYNVLTATYVVSAINQEGQKEFYNVEEYYRLKYSPTRMFVLNFERKMDRIFSTKTNFMYNGSQLKLGITDENVNYKVSEAGGVVAFVQQGDLWNYNIAKNTITRVFSFKDDDKIDVRSNNNKHSIKIINVDEAGSVDFVVDGYMNRGDHEGDVGIGIYHYDGIAGTVKEESFIPMNQPYEIVKAKLGEFVYENNDNEVFIKINGDLQKIDLSNSKSQKMISNLKDNTYRCSKSNQFVAWVSNKGKTYGKSLNLMNLANKHNIIIKEEAGYMLKPIGFIDEDFVYAIANENEVSVDNAGNTNFPIKAIKIVKYKNNKLSELKNYTPNGRSVVDATIDNYTINITLSDGTVDSIMNREADANIFASIGTVITEKMQTQIYINFKNKLKTQKFVREDAKLVDRDIESLTVKIKDSKSEENYKAYAKGHVIALSDNLSKMISIANANNGFVVDAEGNTVWQRAKRSNCQPMNDVTFSANDANGNGLVKAMSALVASENKNVSIKESINSKKNIKDILQDKLKGKKVLKIKGNTSAEILYYVNKGVPVMCMTGNDSAVLVVGYSESTIFIYDPVTSVTKPYPYQMADEMFNAGKNTYFTYIK
ncbi:hypothetical protein [Lachnobacterium bovis]|uniref:Peptidase_C39 like family protein n=1 Tax=Lachnobacterium bovis TaxID=140626 RepID=A0A1H9P4R7_9FIRM|nr:hypothetical protein [Lachnobacterium bovis]SER42819.1 hypothetical protein SAMN02910429_00079 [Lachnobacterium bovis]